ncbi:hypothetical protein OIU76_017250 [Salix suchowensis]|nr:hypothetical protein OIU76_017250 [Salix suchowensis]
MSNRCNISSCLKRKGSSLQKQASNKLSSLEEDAVEKLMIRLDLISMEEAHQARWLNLVHANWEEDGLSDLNLYVPPKRSR